MLRQDRVPSDQAPGWLTLQIWAGSDRRLCRPSHGSGGCFSHLSSNRLCDVKARMHLFCWMSEQLYLKYIFSIYIFPWEAICAIITWISLYWKDQLKAIIQLQKLCSNFILAGSNSSFHSSKPKMFMLLKTNNNNNRKLGLAVSAKF